MRQHFTATYHHNHIKNYHFILFTLWFEHLPGSYVIKSQVIWIYVFPVFLWNVLMNKRINGPCSILNPQCFSLNVKWQYVYLHLFLHAFTAYPLFTVTFEWLVGNPLRQWWLTERLHKGLTTSAGGPSNSCRCVSWSAPQILWVLRGEDWDWDQVMEEKQPNWTPGYTFMGHFQH